MSESASRPATHKQAAPAAMRCGSTDSSQSLRLLQGTDTHPEQAPHLLKGQELDDAECHIGSEPQAALQIHCISQRCS